MVIDFAGTMLYPSYHKWSTKDSTIQNIVGNSFTLIKATTLDNQLPVVIISKSSKQHKLVIVVKGVKKLRVEGSTADINKVFVHQYNQSFEDGLSITTQARKRLIEMLFVVSSLNETQIFNAFKTIKVGSTTLDQAVSYQLINQCKKDVERLCKFLRKPKSGFTIDYTINDQLQIPCDILLVNKQYKQKQLFQNDRLLLRDRRFAQSIAKRKLRITINNVRLDQRMLIPINLTIKNNEVKLIDKTIQRKYTTYFTQQPKSIELMQVLFDNTLSKLTLKLSNQAVITINGTNVTIKHGGRGFVIRLDAFKSLIKPSITNDHLVNYKDDVDRYKTILQRLNAYTKTSSFDVGGTINNIDDVGVVFMELTVYDQVKASDAINIIDSIMQSIVDNQSMMWEYIMTLSNQKAASKYLEL